MSIILNKQSDPPASCRHFQLPVERAQKPIEIEVEAGESSYSLNLSTEDNERLNLHFIFHLRKPSSKLNIDFKIRAAGESVPSLNLEILHHCPETAATADVRTLVTQGAAPVFRGLIHIDKEAQESESFLSHHSLLVGEAARSYTLPALEIMADRVKCSHGASVHTLSPDDLFYARSRGLSEEEARRLLIEGFMGA